MSLWNTLFGTAWEKLALSVPEISAFLLDHETKTAYSDANLKKLLDSSRGLSYDELLPLISGSEERELGGRTFRVIIAEQNSRHTAGFIQSACAGGDAYPMLPLRSPVQLSEAAEKEKRSLLALIRIERFGAGGLSESDISEAVSAIIAALPEGAMAAAAGYRQFSLLVPGFEGDKVGFLRDIQRVLRGTDGELTFTAGCGAEGVPFAQMARTAEITLFDAVQKGVGAIELYSEERYEQRKADYENMKRFTRLIDNNLFVYNFQPIVSAANGDIVAYEALMRTDKSINMFPLEILDTAAKLGRLYDIEKATMRNTLHCISVNQHAFRDKKLFVNSIPAYILSYSDWDALVQDYGELMEKLVVEMTEQTEIDNDKLAVIHDRLNRCGIPIAIDDYGTGYSNTANLLRYKPKYVKIDRSLIENIDGSAKIQKLVSGLIGFCHENGFYVLAEGVETREELRTMIKLGSDLIQGYYISKPKSFTVEEISADLREEITEFSRLYLRETAKVYRPENGETVYLEQLASEHYGSVFIENENVVIEGQRNKKYNVTIMVKDGIKADITLKNVCLNTDEDDPCIVIGKNTAADVTLDGVNECLNRGISVPLTASLRLLGSGSLLVRAEMSNGFGIGADKDHSPGDITVECSGKLTVIANGESSVGIGGGRNEGNSSIRILSGDVSVSCEGGTCLGIGIVEGGGNIDIMNCCCTVEISAAISVGIGSLTGKINVNMSDYTLKLIMSGMNICGVGAANGGEGRLSFNSGSASCNMHGKMIYCVGTKSGALDCVMASSLVSFYCEGNSVSGIGDVKGSGNVSVRDSEINMLFRTNDGAGICSGTGKVLVENSRENIKINE